MGSVPARTRARPGRRTPLASGCCGPLSWRPTNSLLPRRCSLLRRTCAVIYSQGDAARRLPPGDGQTVNATVVGAVDRGGALARRQRDE